MTLSLSGPESGAGIAWATCTRALPLAGCAVHVVDKSRGPALDWPPSAAVGTFAPSQPGVNETAGRLRGQRP